MDYHDFIEEIRASEFVEDDNTAEAAVKSALGILASELDEETAHHMTDQLPEPLSYEKLRGQQQRPLDITFDQNVSEFSEQFNLSPNETVQLIRRIYHVSKEAIDSETVFEITDTLPPDWADEFDRA